MDRKQIGQSPKMIGLLILLLDTWICYATLVSTRSIAFKLCWIIAITMFPFGGLVLYLPVSLLVK